MTSPLQAQELCPVDELDSRIHSALCEQIHTCEPSPLAWERIVARLRREEGGAQTVPQPVATNRPVPYAIVAPMRHATVRNDWPDMWSGGLLSSWLRWTQLNHQVR